MRSLSFRPLMKNTPLKEGSLIRGYTYSIGDFHSQNEDYLGEPKLRRGVILKKYSNQVFLVQFENSAAKKPNKKLMTNIIKLKKKTNSQKKIQILGTDAYCILLQRKQIEFYNLDYEILNIDDVLKSSFLKHSREKKRAQKYVEQGNLDGLSLDTIDEVFEKWQFTNNELVLSPVCALTKMMIIKYQHDREKCTLNEYKRYRNCLPYIVFPINSLVSVELNDKIVSNFTNLTLEQNMLFCEILKKEWKNIKKNKTDKKKPN